MAISISRVQFLRGDVRGERAPLRPPWTLFEAVFADVCSRCGDCIEACPEDILTAGRGRFPEVDFSRGECTFCGQCRSRCAEGAFLKLAGADEAPWSAKAIVGDSCLAQLGVVCSACAEHCEADAIGFEPRVGRVPLPTVDLERCTGCGACYAPCPVSAIAVRQPPA